MKNKKQIQRKYIFSVFLVIVIIISLILFVYAEGEGGGGAPAGGGGAPGGGGEGGTGGGQAPTSQPQDMKQDQPVNVGSGVEATAQGSGLQIQQGQGTGAGGGEGQGQAGGGNGNGAGGEGSNGNGYSIENTGQSAQQVKFNWNDEGISRSQTFEVGAGQTFNFDTKGMDSGGGLTIKQGTEGVSMTKSTEDTPVNFENGATVNNMKAGTEINYQKGDEQTTNPSLTPPTGNFDVNSVSGTGSVELDTSKGVNLADGDKAFFNNVQGDINVGSNGAYVPDKGNFGGQLPDGKDFSVFHSDGNTLLTNGPLTGNQIPDGYKAVIESTSKGYNVDVGPGGSHMVITETSLSKGEPSGIAMNFPPGGDGISRTEVDQTGPTERIAMYNGEKPQFLDLGTNQVLSDKNGIYSYNVGDPKSLQNSVEITRYDSSGNKIDGASLYQDGKGGLAMVPEGTKLDVNAGTFTMPNGDTQPIVSQNMPSVSPESNAEIGLANRNAGWQADQTGQPEQTPGQLVEGGSQAERVGGALADSQGTASPQDVYSNIQASSAKITASGTIPGGQYGSGTASGTIIKGADGSYYAITAAHTFTGMSASSISVDVGGSRYSATLAKIDSQNDLALLRINAQGNLPSSQVAPSGYNVIGQGAITAGYNQGGPLSLDSGYVQSTNPYGATGPQGEQNYHQRGMQISTTNPSGTYGRSGGGAFNGNGQLIGVASAVHGTYGHYVNLDAIQGFLRGIVNFLILSLLKY